MRLTAVVLAMILLSACAVQQAETKEPEKQVQVVEVNKTVEINKTIQELPAPKPEQDTGPAPKIINEPIAKKGIVNELLHDINENIESYSFVYDDTEVLVYGSKIHIKHGYFVEVPFQLNNEKTYITDSYTDLHTKQTISYCDVRGEERILGSFNADRSKCIGLINTEINTSIDDVYVKTPVDWLLEFKDTEPDRLELNDQVLKQPTGWHTVNPVLHFDLPGNKLVVLRIDKNTKMPARIETISPIAERIDYTYLVANRVKPEEVVYKEFIKQEKV